MSPLVWPIVFLAASTIWAFVALVVVREIRNELARRRMHRTEEAKRVRLDLRAERVDLENVVEALRQDFESLRAQRPTLTTSSDIAELKAEVEKLRAAVSPIALERSMRTRVS